MLPASAAVLYIGAALMFLAVCGFGWAWWHGQLSGGTAQAAIILDEDDLRYERPWETPAQQAARQADHGPLVPPPPGEWGGSA